MTNQPNEKILEEFREKFQEFLLPGTVPSPKGTQRIWTSAYQMRTGLESWLNTKLNEVRENFATKATKEFLEQKANKFLDEVRQEERERIKEIIEKMKKENEIAPNNGDFYGQLIRNAMIDGRNQAISDILKQI